MWPFKKKPIVLCKDCKHVRGDTSWGGAGCAAFPSTTDLVDGSTIKMPCSTARKVEDLCGKSGKMFKIKESQ